MGAHAIVNGRHLACDDGKHWYYKEVSSMKFCRDCKHFLKHKDDADSEPWYECSSINLDYIEPVLGESYRQVLLCEEARAIGPNYCGYVEARWFEPKEAP